MNLKDFKSGYFRPQAGYKSFHPSEINHEWILSDPEINKQLTEASRLLGQLDMFSNYIPNIDLFISAHVAKEATTSSKIEGTQTNMEEAFLNEEDVTPEKRDDWREVQNYIKAMNGAIKELENLPLSNRLLRKTHQTLLSSARGVHKLPGEFRSSQNWIGGSSIADATFIPPHFNDLDALMGDLEKFIHNEEIHTPAIIRIAIIHYQFETIHPFLDGNGRIGRLLITLYLVSQNILNQPILYLSDFFEKHRAAYYDKLMSTRLSNDLAGWIKFFLVGVITTAQKSISTFSEILKLKEETDNYLISNQFKGAHCQALIEHLYKSPIIDANTARKIVDASAPTVYKILSDLEAKGFLQELTRGKRNRVFIFQKYLSLFHS